MAEKANSRVTIPSTLKTNIICPLSSSLILLVSGLPLCLCLLNKCVFKLGQAMLYPIIANFDWAASVKGFSLDSSFLTLPRDTVDRS